MSYNKPISRTAEKDIPVFKIMDNFQDKLTSFYYGFEYQKGIVYYNPLGDINRGTWKKYTISSGFHSYSPNCYILFKSTGRDRYAIISSLYKDRALDNIGPLKEIYVKVSCIIPKGSIYYINEYGEYISNQIKIIDYNVLG